ncbi:MAG: glutathione S-transferase family protein [Polyangiales bacterium]
MDLVFYTAPMSSATPVATVLAELQIPHETVVVDLSKGEEGKGDLRKHNPHAKVPTLLVDGTPMFEALAIMQWLGDRFGVERGLWPAPGDPARLQALSWTTWSYVEYGPAMVRFYLASHDSMPAEMKNAAQAERAKEQLDTHLRILDERLAERGWLIGDAFSLADLIVANVIAYGAVCGVGVERHERVAAWLSACQGRPSFQSAWG